MTLARAHPCPTCGCESPCEICESPNETASSIFITFTITGVVNYCTDCEAKYNDTFVLEMERQELDETYCYLSAAVRMFGVCGDDLFAPGVVFTASITQPNEDGEVTVYVSQNNGSTGEFVASKVLTLPVDCASFGAAVSMTIDSISPGPPGGGAGEDLCDVALLAIEFSLSV